MDSIDRRKGADSRCCTPQKPPLKWVYAEDKTHQDIREFHEWMESLAPFARIHEEGEQADLFEAAASGELSESADHPTPIKPIRTHPDVYELRRTGLNKKLRFYHAEPEKYPQALVRLHYHIKTDGHHQQLAIEQAVTRYTLPNS